MGSRRVHFVGCTAPPDNAWVTQQARDPAIWSLIRDNDKKFSRAFDAVFRTEGMDVIPTLYRAPNANAFAERWIRSEREECLDKLLIINQAHLRRVMREYVEFFNTARPHQGIGKRISISPATLNVGGPIRCRNVLGSIIHEYCRNAAQAKTGAFTRFLGYRHQYRRDLLTIISPYLRVRS
jgi:putative transposase